MEESALVRVEAEKRKVVETLTAISQEVLTEEERQLEKELQKSLVDYQKEAGIVNPITLENIISQVENTLLDIPPKGFDSNADYIEVMKDTYSSSFLFVFVSILTQKIY